MVVMGTEPLSLSKNLKFSTVFIPRQNFAFKQRSAAINHIDDIAGFVAEHTDAVGTLLLIESAYVSADILSVK